MGEPTHPFSITRNLDFLAVFVTALLTLFTQGNKNFVIGVRAYKTLNPLYFFGGKQQLVLAHRMQKHW